MSIFTLEGDYIDTLPYKNIYTYYIDIIEDNLGEKSKNTINTKELDEH